jgi:hypothetical protein
MQSWCWYLRSSSVVVSPGGWVRRQALWTTICPISGGGSSPAYCQTVCLSRLWLLKVHAEFSSLLLPCSPVRRVPSAPSAVCLFSSLFITQFFFGGAAGVSLSAGYAYLSQGWLWEYHVLLICSPVGLYLPSRFGASI